MRVHHRRKRADDARDLALAYLGATSITDGHLKGVIDRHITRVIDAAEGTDGDVPCRCELQKPTQLRPGETAKQSLDGLSFVYCDRRGVESAVEYRPAPQSCRSG
jgi:hypothetical protein